MPTKKSFKIKKLKGEMKMVRKFRGNAAAYMRSGLGLHNWETPKITKKL